MKTVIQEYILNINSKIQNILVNQLIIHIQIPEYFSPNPINLSSSSKNLTPNENTHLLKKQIEAQTSNIKNSVSINVIESDLDEKLNISQTQARDHVTININDSLEEVNNNLERNSENTIENTNTGTIPPDTNIENRDVEYIESLPPQNQINIDIDSTQSNI